MTVVKRWIAVLCAMALLMCAVPLGVFAEDTASAAAQATTDVIDTSASDGGIDLDTLTAEDIVGELEGHREADTKHFLLTDGSMLAVSYPLSVHEQVNGKWVEIDNTLTDTTDTDGDSVLQNAAQTVKFSFVQGKGNGRLMKVENTASKAQVIFELNGAQKKNLTIDEPTDSDELFALSSAVQKGTYEEILPDTDIEYILAGNSLKENIVFKTAQAAGTVSFLLRCKNVTAALQDDQSVLLSDSDGNPVFTIPAPFMYDAAGASSAAVTVTLEATNQGYTYTMTPDAAWTQSADRVYPLTLDPMVESSLVSETIEAAFVKESHPTANLKDDTFLWVGSNATDSTCYSLLQFTLPTLTAADYVVDSRLYLHASLASTGMDGVNNWRAWSSTHLNGSKVLEAHAITAAWDEDTVTWNNKPSFSSSIMDAVTLTSANAPVINSAGTEYTPTVTRLNVTELAHDWYHNGVVNNGILLKLNQEDGHAFAAEFFSDTGSWQANGDMNVHPQLAVQYRSKAGLEDAYSYSSVSAGSAGTAYVQLNSGNLVFVHDDGGLSGGSMPVSISHVYNTCNLATNLGYGRGWTLNYAQTLKKETIGSATYYAYTDADATKHYFKKDDSKTELEDESGLELKLTVSTNSSTIKDKDDNQYIFNSSGLLTTIKNAYGKTITITYTNAKISKITDGLGRVYDFAYQNGLLLSVRFPDGQVIEYAYTDQNLTSIIASQNNVPYESNTYTYGVTNVLLQATDTDGNDARMNIKGEGRAARVINIAHRVAVSTDDIRTRAKSTITYNARQTTVTDIENNKSVTYQFNSWGNTRCIYNSEGQAQYYRYYAPNEQNENGTSTYGPNKLEAASQTHWVATNRLYNHSFESETDWTGNLSYSTWEPFSGKKSLLFNNREDTAAKTAYQSVAMTGLVKGATYTLSAYMRTLETDDTSVSTLFVDLGAGTTPLSSNAVLGNKEWHRVETTFTVPADTTATALRVGLQTSGAGLGYFDAVQLEKNTAANRYNLLENADFSRHPSDDNVHPDSWTLSIGGISAVAGVVSTPAAPSSIGLTSNCYTMYSYSLASSTSSSVYSKTTLSQTVNINSGTKGTTLSYGSWMRADSLPESYEEDDDIRFGVTIKLYNGTTVVQTQTTHANRFCEAWQFVGDVIVAKQAFTKAEILLQYVNNCNTAYFDGAFLYRDYFGQSYTYDDDGNVISTQSYADQNASFEYNASDDLTKSVSPKGAEYTYTYNDMHDVETGTSAEGVTYAYRFDEDSSSKDAGTVKSASTVLGTANNTAAVDTVYDENNNPSSQTTADVRGNAVTYTYNPDGTVATATDATGVVTSYTYDTRKRTTAVRAETADGTLLSEIGYTYDSHSRLASIQNGEVCYFFAYDTVDRLLSVSVGTSAENAVTLSTNSYAAVQNGVYADEITTATYGNGDTKTYTYDDLDRVVGVKYEGDTADRFTYVYDREGNLASMTDTDTGVTVTYQYDLSKRLSQIQMSDGYTLTYEYDAENCLSSVTEEIGGVAQSTNYVYNKDNLITKATSPTGSTVSYDYSYNRRQNLYELSPLRNHADTYGFATDVTGVTVEAYDAQRCPVMDSKAVRLSRSENTAVLSNSNSFRLISLMDGHRYILSLWYKAENGADGTLEASLVCTNGTAQTADSETIVADGEWHYAEFVLTAAGPLYTTSDDRVSPTVTWTNSTGGGDLILNGWSFANEMETVFIPGDLTQRAADSTAVADGASNTAVTDTTAPMPTAPVRKWIKTDGSTQWIGYGGKALLTSTPQPGEVWEFTFHAKFESGTQGDGIRVWFRKYNKNGSAFEGAASTEYTVKLTEDNAWHTYKAYVVINDDAYTHNNTVTPYFGWKTSTGAGVMYINGVTVRRVGNQWNNAVDYLGFTPSTNELAPLEEVDSADSPIAYQKTVRVAHNGTMYTSMIHAPLSSFPQPTATDTWTLSFWAKTNGTNRVYLYDRTQPSTAPKSTALQSDGAWHYYIFPLVLGDGFDLSSIALYYSLEPQTELYLNGISLVPGTVALANDSHQNSAALKNITVDTGSAKFNTAIEYDTDADRAAYSRIKHYIIDGEPYSYEYDEAGNISKIQSPDGSYVTYTYDALNQLTAETHSLPLEGKVSPQATDEVSYTAIAYQYDTRGNILVKTYSLDGTTVGAVNYGYTDTVWKDRLTSYNGSAITYDEIGNPLSWYNGATMSWQHGRQLAGYTDSANTISYTYDDEGIRTSKTVNGTTTSYTVVDGTLRRMTDGTNTLQFINGTSVIFNGVEYWYVFNAQNDVIGIIDTNGDYVVQYTYDSWGKPLSKTGTLADTLGTLNPIRYRGYIYDEETGFYYVSSRYYDPAIGRWINADEYASTGHGTLGHNMFAYCLNNPVNMIDSTGELPQLLIAAAVGAIVNVATTVIAAMVTGQEITLMDIAVAAGTGAISSFGGGWHLLSGAISGIYTAYTTYKETSSLNKALVSGAISTATSTLTIGYGAESFLKEELSLATSTVVDLSFGLGGNVISSAATQGITKVDKTNIQNNTISLSTPTSPILPSTPIFSGQITSSNMYVMRNNYPITITSGVASAYTVRI